jgi:hypothetical protein
LADCDVKCIFGSQREVWVKGDWVSFTVKSLSDTNIIAGVLSEEEKKLAFQKDYVT